MTFLKESGKGSIGKHQQFYAHEERKVSCEHSIIITQFRKVLWYKAPGNSNQLQLVPQGEAR